MSQLKYHLKFRWHCWTKRKRKEYLPNFPTYDPEAGRILIDGYDISKVSLSSIRQQIGIVPQDCLLLKAQFARI